MEALEIAARDSGVQRESGEADEAITAEERAEWLIDYILLHQREDRSQLLRIAVQQIVAAEEQAYERGVSHGASSGFADR